jgi:hypothetical protein
LLTDVIDNVQKKDETQIIRPNVKQVLSQLLLADCSHRIYMTKQELAYKVMDLPQIIRSFSEVKTVAHYPRATLVEEAPESEHGYVELNDCTSYSAYCERCSKGTKTSENLTMDMLQNMNLRDFSESVNFKWVHHEYSKTKQPVSGKTNRKWKSRDKLSGYWYMSLKTNPTTVRSSTILYTDLAKNFVPDDNIDRFVDLSRDQQNLLKRAYQELIMYEPWKTENPDDHFLSPEVNAELESDPDRQSRYSLRRLMEYWRVYMSRVEKGTVAPPGSKWQRDNLYSYTMYLTSRHNKCVKQDRADNDGMFYAEYVAAEELEGTGTIIRPNVVSENDNDEYPSALNYVPSDFLRGVELQEPPTVDELSVAFPEHGVWKQLEKTVRRVSSGLFMAKPNKPNVQTSQLTPMQQHAVELINSGEEKVLYIIGKAGTGKTLTGLMICHCPRFVGRVQAAAGTGKAASNFNGPTIHGAFLWSANRAFNSSTMTQAKKQKLQNFYENTELFLFDEVLASGADILCMIDETMKELFCKRNSKGARVDKPFGGKTVVFLGDPAQLPPVGSAAIYDESVGCEYNTYKSQSAKLYFKNAKKGQEIYRKYLVPQCVYLQQGKRNSGILQEIMDRLREGKHTAQDLDMLTFMRRRNPDFTAERGIHYSNESATMFNCVQLWEDCTQRKRRFYTCHALYYTTQRNENVVRMLSTIPASKFGYAADILCLSPGLSVVVFT